MIYADLHTHTNYTDGVNTIEELLKKAQAAGIKKLAVTDHDTMFHLPIIAEQATNYDIELIPGVELSLFDYTVNRRVHMLGLFFPELVPDKINQEIQALNNRREQFHKIMIERFTASGYPITFEDVKKYAPYNIPYKMHIFLALFEKHLQQLSKAELKQFYMEEFGKPQSKEDDALVAYPDIQTGINWILESGGIPCIAHPNLYDSFDQVEGYIAMGMQGIECYHSQMKPEDTTRALAIAAKHQLYITGGSDYHGDLFGTPDQTLGNFGLDETQYNELISLVSSRH